MSMAGIPYRQIVGRTITISNGVLCESYSGIQITAVASCEADMSVYQYGVVRDETSGNVLVSYEPANRIYASSSIATFPNFAFPTSSPDADGGGGGAGGDALSVNSGADAANTSALVTRIYGLMLAAVILLFIVLILVAVAMYHLLRVKGHAKSTRRMVMVPVETNGNGSVKTTEKIVGYSEVPTNNGESVDAEFLSFREVYDEPGGGNNENSTSV